MPRTQRQVGAGGAFLLPARPQGQRQVSHQGRFVPLYSSSFVFLLISFVEAQATLRTWRTLLQGAPQTYLAPNPAVGSHPKYPCPSQTTERFPSPSGDLWKSSRNHPLPILYHFALSNLNFSITVDFEPRNSDCFAKKVSFFGTE